MSDWSSVRRYFGEDVDESIFEKRDYIYIVYDKVEEELFVLKKVMGKFRWLSLRKLGGTLPMSQVLKEIRARHYVVYSFPDTETFLKYFGRGI